MDTIIYEKVGQRLKFARELRNITLEEAGAKVSVHKSTVLRWENGETEKFKIPTLEALAILYNVNPAWLMGYDVPMENNHKDIDVQQKIKDQYGENSINLLNNYSKLNNLGKQKVEETAEDCTTMLKYTEKKNELNNA